MTDASGTTNYEYTPKGQVAKETKVIDTVTYVTQYAYDQNGNLKTMTYPSGKVITYNYSNDRAISVLNNAVNIASDIQYEPFGGMKLLSYGNGLVGSVSYDNQYRISALTVGTAGSILNYSYTNDYNGNITGITNNNDGTKNKSYIYDPLDRLKDTTGPWGSLGWTYDGVGNRGTQTENASTSTYAYQTGTNKLTGISGAQTASFTFDVNGNTDTENLKDYVYNQNQRLIEVIENGSTVGEYTYNGNGQRVKKVAGRDITVFHYDMAGRLIAESNSRGSIASEYIYLNGQPLAKIEGNKVYYYHNDHLGTPQKMTDTKGNVVWDGEFKPFGEAISVTGTVTNNLRFPGQYFDEETGLNYNYFRDYNPVIGRYVQADPIGIQQGQNHLYIYVYNNPINLIDPKGLIATPSTGCAYDTEKWFLWNLFNWLRKDVPTTLKGCATATLKCFVCSATCSIKLGAVSYATTKARNKILNEIAKRAANEIVKKVALGAIPVTGVISNIQTAKDIVSCSYKCIKKK